jgi:hypothetical protein
MGSRCSMSRCLNLTSPQRILAHQGAGPGPVGSVAEALPGHELCSDPSAGPDCSRGSGGTRRAGRCPTVREGRGLPEGMAREQDRCPGRRRWPARYVPVARGAPRRDLVPEGRQESAISGRANSRRLPPCPTRLRPSRQGSQGWRSSRRLPGTAGTSRRNEPPPRGLVHLPDGQPGTRLDASFGVDLYREVIDSSVPDAEPARST